MSDENKDVKAEATVQPTLDAEAIAKAERERIQSVEALAKMSDGKHPSIVAAVREKVDSVKYDAGVNIDAAEMMVLKTINAAQDKLLAEFAADHKQVNAAAEHTAKATAEEAKTKQQAEHDARTNELVAAAKESNK